MLRQVRKGAARKKHVYKDKNENGRNATKPVKYTAGFVLKEAKSMLKALREGPEVAGHHPRRYGTQLFAGKPYTYQRFSEWAKKYKDDEKISEGIEKIDVILEDRLMVGKYE